jgi:hypothetical protein
MEGSEHDSIEEVEIGEMLELRLSEKTKLAYQSSLNVFWDYLQKNTAKYPNIALPGKRINLNNLSLVSIQMFLLKRQKKEKKSFRALSVRLTPVLLYIYYLFAGQLT